MSDESNKDMSDIQPDQQAMFNILKNKLMSEISQTTYAEGLIATLMAERTNMMHRIRDLEEELDSYIDDDSDDDLGDDDVESDGIDDDGGERNPEGTGLPKDATDGASEN